MNSKYIEIKSHSKKYLFTKEGEEFAKDYILNQKGSYFQLSKIFDIDYGTCSSLCKEYDIIKDNRTKYSLNEKYFDEINTPEKAYWLGFLCADGSIGHNRNSIRLALQENDKPHIEKFNKAINSNRPLRQRIIDNKYYQYQLSIVNKHMRDALINHGCVPNKSLTLKPPKNIPKELNIYWILGYFDGDGCISVYISREKYLRLKTSFTGTYEVLDFIKKELKWKSTIRKEHRCENTYNISATEGPSQNFLNLVYNDASKEFCLERKYKKYQYYLEEKLARSMK